MRRIIKGHRVYIPKAESPLVLWLKEFKFKEFRLYLCPVRIHGVRSPGL